MLPTWYNKYKQIIDESINKYLDSYLSDNKTLEGLEEFKNAIYYSVKGGKRIRSIFAIEFYLTFSDKKIEDINNTDNIIRYCVSLEFLHAYSLVHDDLPCMDNDELRRGELTVWKKYGENTAVLVGDTLNSLSYEILAEIGNISLIKYFGKAVGINGMIGGQVLDLYYENNPNKLDLDKLIDVHNKKTGALIEMSILGGIILANLNLDKNNRYKKSDLTKYLDFGKKIGLAFQVKDDLLDVEGTIEETGKSVGEESKGFVYFNGLDNSKDYLDKLINDSLNIISPLKSEKLNFLVEYIGNRKK